MSKYTAIVLAGGLGKRMHSKHPKVLHTAAGRTLLGHVVTAVREGGISKIRVVVGHQAELVKSSLSGVEFFHQKEQRGTADAVKSAEVDSLHGLVLICNGDHPLITGEDFKEIFAAYEANPCDLLVVGARLKNPSGLGRLVCIGRKLEKIVEQKDASPQELRIQDVNAGIYVVRAEILQKYLPQISNQNKQNEFYLTDLVSLLVRDQKSVEVLLGVAPRVCRGVNNLFELARVEKALHLRKAKELSIQGVLFEDPWSTYIDCDVAIEKGTRIGSGTRIVNKSTIGADCVIESHCFISNTRIGSSTQVKWGTVIEDSHIGSHCRVGPYARLRPDTKIGNHCHIGNFVELKKVNLEDGVKANHLTYLGDADIGEGTNIGCGTITCNYAVDRKKYRTTIGKNVFVGSDTQFIAPIRIGDGAVIGSGSTVTKDVPERALAVARGKQIIKENFNKE